MDRKYRFDAVARAERYYVTTLLSHLLMVENFKGTQVLFGKLLGNEKCLKLNQDFEIVSELDPLRDASLYNQSVKELYSKHQRVAVPDLFLRWDNQCIILEAKFFTDPTDDELKEQVDLQKKAIELIKDFTIYKNHKFLYLILTVKRKKYRKLYSITWDEIIEALNNSFKSSMENPMNLDYIYSIEKIKEAIIRAKSEFSNTGKKVTFEYYKSFQDLMSRVDDLLLSKKYFIGFDGGLNALDSVSDKTKLINRGYRVTEIRWTDNLVSIGELIKKYCELSD